MRVTSYVCQAQKSFHDNMVWALQGSRSQGEYYVHLAKFNTNYPDVKVKRACYYLMHGVFLSIAHLRKGYFGKKKPRSVFVHCRIREQDTLPDIKPTIRHNPKNSTKFKGLYKGLVLDAERLVVSRKR